MKTFSPLNSLILITLIIVTMFISISSIQASNIQDNLKQVGGEAYYNDKTRTPGETNPVNIVGDIIKVALGFLGLIFVILIIWSGYQWMTAGGNSEAITAAKKRMLNAVIGLIIVLSAFTITFEVLSRIGEPIVGEMTG